MYVVEGIYIVFEDDMQDGLMSIAGVECPSQQSSDCLFDVGDRCQATVMFQGYEGGLDTIPQLSHVTQRLN